MQKSQISKVVTIFRGLHPRDVLPATECLIREGYSCFEVTVDSPDAYTTLTSLISEFGDEASIGLGTVRSREEVVRAADLNAAFIVSPHVEPTLVRTAHDCGLIAIPGALTPTEICLASDAGADVVKLFPLAPLGPEYIRHLRGPFPTVPLLVTGGVTAELARECLAAGCAGVGVSVNLLSEEAVRERAWERLADAGRKYLAAIGDLGQ